jgi:hypothetical protein
MTTETITATVEAGSSLLLEPAHELRFALDRARQKATAHLVLTNVSVDRDVTFKVRTRNPDVFAVKPTHGVIHPGGSAEIAIVVAPRSVSRLVQMRPKDLEARRSSDLFLIQSIELTSDMRLAKPLMAQEEPPSTESLRAFWKQVPREVVDENKLACRFVVSTGSWQPVGTNAQLTSFLSANESMVPDLMATARESFASQSTFYADCFSEMGDGNQIEPGHGSTTREETPGRHDRLSFSSMSSMNSSGIRHHRRHVEASPINPDRGHMSTSELNRENLRRLSSDSSSSWVTASRGSPTNSDASVGTTKYDDCRSMTSTMLDSNDTMLSARSSISTATTSRAPVTPGTSTNSLLFSIHPHDVLKFQVKRAPRYWSSSSFFIVNASQTDCLTFKVRTTNQDGYYVKPTRGLVAVTSAQKIEIQLCAPREGFIDRPRREARDAFLIEVAAMSPERYHALEALDGRQQSRELSSLWSILPPNDRRSEMLTVELAVDPEDEADVCTPIRSHGVTMGKRPGLGSSRVKGTTASGEPTRGDSGRRFLSSSRLAVSQPPHQSSAAPPKPQSVMIVSPDTMDLVDFSDPEVSFFV